MCDIWSVGALTHAMLTSYLPIDGENSAQILNQAKDWDFNKNDSKVSSLSLNSLEFLGMMLSRDPKQRKKPNILLNAPFITVHNEVSLHDKGLE